MTDVLADIKKSLLEDREEGREHGEIVADDAAIATCELVAAEIADWLANPPEGFKWAASGNDGGGVELVCHSKSSKRRVSFQIPADGLTIRAHTIDEHMKQESSAVATADAGALRAKVEWVVPLKGLLGR